MIKIGSKKQKTFGIALFLIIVLFWVQEPFKKDIMPYPSILMWIIISIVLLFSFIFIFSKIRDKKILNTVTKSNRGTKTERDLVLKLLKHGIPAQTIFHDLYVKKKDGDFSQIDLVVVTKVGIIVFEVKDFSGWIYGNGNYAQWTQVLAYGKNKYRFYNPIMQNNKHIIDLKMQLEQFQNIPFYSIVVFYGDCVLKEVSFVPNGTYLVKSKRVLEVMKIIAKNNEPAPYTNKADVVRILKEGVQNGENMETQIQHIGNIKNMLGKERIFE
ncbi:MAG: nuclease-related domain-containing protein [Bacteroidota bacterium]